MYAQSTDHSAPVFSSRVELQTNIDEAWRACSSCLDLPVRVKSQALRPAFEAAATRCGTDHTMSDPGDPMLDSCVPGWGRWTFIWMWRPDISPLLPRWLLHYRDHLPLTSPFSPETLLVGVKKKKKRLQTLVLWLKSRLNLCSRRWSCSMSGLKNVQ